MWARLRLPLVQRRRLTDKIQDLDSLKLYVGKDLGWSQYINVDKARVQRFCDATNDWQWIHLDEDRAAKESIFGAAIAPGFLSLSLIVPFLDDVVGDLDGVTAKINVGLNRVRFTGPVFVGDRLRGHFHLKSLDDVRGGQQAVYKVECWTENNDQKPVAVIDSLIRYLTVDASEE